MKTKLEKAMELVEISRRKNSTSRAWDYAETAAEIAGVEVVCEESSNYPDLDLLEKEIRAALDDCPLIVSCHSRAVEWLKLHGVTGEVWSPSSVGVAVANGPRQLTVKWVTGFLRARAVGRLLLCPNVVYSRHPRRLRTETP